MVDREWLKAQLEAGRSIESIAVEVGKAASTVAYWVQKYGLESAHAERHAARGALSRELLEEMVAAGLTVREIAEEIGRSPTTVRHWLSRYDLRTHRQQSFAGTLDPDLDEAQRRCRHHGMTRYVRDGRGHLRCAACRRERVSQRRRDMKRMLVAEAGGACIRCGYDKYLGALHFHHLDPSQKSFSLGVQGITRAIARVREEAQKCVLLCANCHAEVEGGVSTLPPA